MTPLSVTARIWAKTVLLNVFFWGMGALYNGDIFDMLGSAVLFIGGIVATPPMIMLMLPLVKISEELPYGIPARIAWLTFYLILLIVLFYTALSLIENNVVYKSNSFTARLMGTALASLFVSVITTRSSLNKLYTQS
jgi:hypothetical protein